MSDESTTNPSSNPTFEDARTITKLVKEYFENTYPQLSFLFFRIESMEANTQENVWKVVASFKKSFGSNKRMYYELKVNSKTGQFGNVKIIKEDET